jgi:hypothetical protein
MQVFFLFDKMILSIGGINAKEGRIFSFSSSFKKNCSF